jgi:hypothetical protein
MKDWLFRRAVKVFFFATDTVSRPFLAKPFHDETLAELRARRAREAGR